MMITVDALIGKAIAKEKKKDIRGITYNYLDLCNEQTYLINKKKVSKVR